MRNKDNTDMDKPNAESDQQPPLRGAVKAVATPEIIPRASLLTRAIAFLMDGALVSAVGILLLTRILLPIHHHEGMREFQDIIGAYAEQTQQAVDSGSERPHMPDLREHEAITAMFAFAQSVLLTLIWAYFFFSEWAFKGATLGKKTFSLRAVNTYTGAPPSFFEILLRTSFKSLTLVGHPVFLINFIIPVFNRDRRAGHDFLARTRVTNDTLSDSRTKNA